MNNMQEIAVKSEIQEEYFPLLERLDPEIAPHHSCSSSSDMSRAAVPMAYHWSRRSSEQKAGPIAPIML
jgi:hypothetical protein